MSHHVCEANNIPSLTTIKNDDFFYLLVGSLVGLWVGPSVGFGVGPLVGDTDGASDGLCYEGRNTILVMTGKNEK